MLELILKPLSEANILLEKQVPQFKDCQKQISIEDVSPFELPKFMQDNNIPSDATFWISNDTYNQICLDWTIKIPTTTKDKMEFRHKRFGSIAFKFIYDTLIKNGYVRKPFSSTLIAEFKGVTVYSMFINKEFDQIVKYYSAYYKKVS